MSKHFKPEFRLAVAQLVVDKGYTLKKPQKPWTPENQPPTSGLGTTLSGEAQW